MLSNAPPNAVRNALWWMMGSVADAGWLTVGWLAAYVALGGALLLWLARDIDILSLGEESAAALGVDAARSSRVVFLVAALLSAATVAAAGLVGFVGLVVPHLVRSFGVRRHRALIAGAALVGAGLVVAADLVARLARSARRAAAGRRDRAPRRAVFSRAAPAAVMIAFDRAVVRYPRASRCRGKRRVVLGARVVR